MKSYTDIEQSRKLTEILPFESADQAWARIAIAGANLDVPEELQYRHNGDMPFQYYSGIGIPCWSLAALLDILPNGTDIVKEEADTENEHYMCTVGIKDGIISTFANNSIDACYNMIMELKERNLL